MLANIYQAVQVRRESKPDQTRHDVVCVQGREGHEVILGQYEDPWSIGKVWKEVNQKERLNSTIKGLVNA